MFGSGMHPLDLASHTTLIISNEKMNDIIKIVRSIQESDLLVKSVSKAIKNEAKELKGGFFGMFLGTLGASLLGNLLAGKGSKAQLELVKEQLELARIFNVTSSFNKFWNTKVLSKWI